jgi:hypothetical protein
LESPTRQRPSPLAGANGRSSHAREGILWSSTTRGSIDPTSGRRQPMTICHISNGPSNRARQRRKRKYLPSPKHEEKRMDLHAGESVPSPLLCNIWGNGCATSWTPVRQMRTRTWPGQSVRPRTEGRSERVRALPICPLHHQGDTRTQGLHGAQQ